MPEQQNQSPAETYESFLGPALFAPWASVLLDRAALVPGERVLDLACGTGIVTRQAAQRLGTGARLVGADVNPDMLAVARTHPEHAGLGIEWRQENACELHLPANSFDVVLCQQGFQFFPDRAKAAREVYRTLVAGGRAVIAVWQSLDRHEVLKALFSAESKHLQLPLEQVATPFSLPEAAGLRSLLHDAGFGKVEIEDVSLDVSFPSADRWVELTVRAGAAVIPELAHDGEAQEELLESVQRESADAVNRHRSGDGLEFPMHAHVAIAQK